MTNSELYASVSQLGFEDVLEHEGRYVYAVNRALYQINALRPLKGLYYINHKPLKNAVRDSFFAPRAVDGTLMYEAFDVKSYYFESDGPGVCYIEKCEGGGEWTLIGIVDIERSDSYKPYRGFIKYDGEFFSSLVRLRFTGEFIFGVRSVAMYSQIFSNEVSDIPAFEAYTRYDVSAAAEDFLTFDAPPIKEYDGYTNLNQEYTIEGGRVILLPYGMNGLYTISYKRKPRLVKETGEPEEDMTVIDLDEELCTLLPLLVAAYVWMDDEPEKAQYYLSMYQSRAAEIESKNRNHAPVRIKDVYGW